MKHEIEDIYPICNICDEEIKPNESTVTVIWFYGKTFHFNCRFSKKGHEYLGEKA